jgi:apolipoprotein N-acyltransferase
VDFPPLLGQAGRQKVDILLSPASDWTAIDPRHTKVAQFHAIEQGFNLVRQANLGLSAAYDYEGRTLAAMDNSHSNDFSLVAYVPTPGYALCTANLRTGSHGYASALSSSSFSWSYIGARKSPES